MTAPSGEGGDPARTAFMKKRYTTYSDYIINSPVDFEFVEEVYFDAQGRTVAVGWGRPREGRGSLITDSGKGDFLDSLPFRSCLTCRKPEPFMFDGSLKTE